MSNAAVTSTQMPVATPKSGYNIDAFRAGFLRFPGHVEREFQEQYFARIRPTLRIIALLLGVMFSVYARRDYLDTQSYYYAATNNGAPALFFLTLCGLTFVPSFDFVWQITILFGGFIAVLISLSGITSMVMAAHAPDADAVQPFSATALFFGQQLRLLMICMGVLRLQFKWALMLQLGLLLFGSCLFFGQVLDEPLTADVAFGFLRPTISVMVAMMMSAWFEERLARTAFESNRKLAELQAEEHQKRVETEGMLHILGQSIGGIVHDLGGPLTKVQMGAQTLDIFLEVDTDKATLREFTSAINNGVQMLDFLRLSLIEQTRVLEGKPTAVNLQSAGIRSIVEAGRHFQKPYIVAGRQVIVEGEDVRIYADEMKLVTVFMNLIGNALKYSDGDVRIIWREFRRAHKEGAKSDDRVLLVVIGDQGMEGKGITREGAAQLFTAFARLETHKAIEGTGLGLISVAHILEAHGGEVFIQGYESGLPGSPPFTTGPAGYPFVVGADFRTAFVVVCPLEPVGTPAPDSTSEVMAENADSRWPQIIPELQ